MNHSVMMSYHTDDFDLSIQATNDTLTVLRKNADGRSKVTVMVEVTDGFLRDLARFVEGYAAGEVDDLEPLYQEVSNG